MVVNKDGDIFVKDDRKIQVFTAEGQFQREFGQKVLKRPYGEFAIEISHTLLSFRLQDST